MCERVSEDQSHVKSQKPRQSNHSLAEKKIWYQVLSFSFLSLFFFCSFSSSSYHERRAPVSWLWQQTSNFPQCWTVCSLISQLSTWIYIFIYMNWCDSEFHFSRGEDKRCCLWGLALVEACCVVYRWTMCLTLDLRLDLFFCFCFFGSL